MLHKLEDPGYGEAQTSFLLQAQTSAHCVPGKRQDLGSSPLLADRCLQLVGEVRSDDVKHWDSPPLVRGCGG